jgi:hypothetical protein
MPADESFDYKISILNEEPKDVFVAFDNPVSTGDFIKVDDWVAKVIYVVHSFGESEIIASKNITESKIISKFT